MRPAWGFRYDSVYNAQFEGVAGGDFERFGCLRRLAIGPFITDFFLERLELGLLDTISVPPGVCRAFRNISDEEGILQVVISGGVHDMSDIDFPEAIGDRLGEFGQHKQQNNSAKRTADDV